MAFELALAIGGCTEDLDAEADDTGSSDGGLDDDERSDVLGSGRADGEQPGTEQDHCDDQAGEAECFAAGCRWQPIVGAMLESDDSCSFGEPLGLCFAESLAEPCEPDARRCADGSFAWVLPGPDNAAVLAYSATSCGVPDHFMPCPTMTAPGDLTADVDVPPNGADDLDAVALTACTCACEDN